MHIRGNQHSPVWAKFTFVCLIPIFFLWLIPNAVSVCLSDIYSLSAKNTIATYDYRNTFDLNQWLEAKEQLKNALSIAPDDPNLLFSMGQVNAIRGYKAKGNKLISNAYYEEAALYYEKALKIRPQDALTWVNLVIALDAINDKSSRYNYALQQARILTKNEKNLADIVSDIADGH